MNDWGTGQDRLPEDIKDRIAELEADRETAVRLVLEAGLSTGHADTCTDLVREVLRDVAELRAENEQLEAELTDTVNALKLCCDATNKLAIARAWIEKAPHDGYCETSLTNGDCDCGKREALEKLGPAPG